MLRLKSYQRCGRRYNHERHKANYVNRGNWTA